MVPMPTLCGKINCKHFYEIIPFFLSCRGPGADVPGPLDTAGFYSVQYSSHFPGFPLRSTGPRGDNTMYEPSTQLNQSAVPIVTLLHLSWPAILEQLLLTAANYVDTAMVGSLGAGATASVAINSSVCFLYNGTVCCCRSWLLRAGRPRAGGAGFVPCQNCGASSSQRGSADGDGGSCLHAPFVLVYSSVAGR